MTYLAARNALLTLCRAYDSGAVFSVLNSAVNDRTVMDSGTEFSINIERTAPTVRGRRVDDIQAHGAMVERHTLTVWLYTVIGTGDGGEGATDEASEVMAEALAAYLAQYERLGGVAARALITEVTEPRRNGTGSHVVQGIEVTAWCKNTALPLEVGE
jgi:hypothetical protein